MADNDALENKILVMKQKLAVMEWDVQRNQINPAKRAKYEKLKEECRKLEEEYKGKP